MKIQILQRTLIVLVFSVLLVNAQENMFKKYLGIYEVPRIGLFEVYLEDGKLYGGPKGRARELLPVKGSNGNFEVFRDGALFAKITFTDTPDGMVMEITANGTTLKGPKQKSDPVTIFEGGTLIDVESAERIRDVSIVVSKNKIVDVYQTGSKQKPANAKTIDVSGKFIIPGLIDAHTHLATSPSGNNNRRSTLEVLEHNLFGGVVAMRDMGGDARTLASLARDANLNELASPNIYYSAIFAGPSFFSDPRTLSSGRGEKPGDVPWLRSVTADTDLPLAIAMAKGTGAKGIKIYASLPKEDVERVTKEAQKQGMEVWAHVAISPASPMDGIEAGVNVLSHADMFIFQQLGAAPNRTQRSEINKGTLKIDEPMLETMLEKMRENKTVLDSTLLVYGKETGQDGRYKIAQRVVRAAFKKGVMLSAGTDNFADLSSEAFPPLHKEMQLMVECGLTPMDAIRSATLVSAVATGIEETHGSVEKDKLANFVILGKDPSLDLTNLTSIKAIVKNGQFYDRSPYVKRKKYKN